ncbi:MAG: flagellar biosynthesis protein FliQ [Desulfobacterota bacterium]|nr:flagellar biosynthesis protein FliQ [Thermodesulfobacteriota bacterium]
MNTELVLHLAKEAIEMTLFLSLPIMGVGLVVGFLISLFQAVTQMHEMTLSFVPKIVAVLVSVLFLGPWMLQKMVTYMEGLLTQLPGWVR